MKIFRSLHSLMMTVFLLSIASHVVISCRSDDPELSSDKAITSFSFLAIDNPMLSSDVPGIISGEEIHCTFPSGVSVTALKPTIVHTGSSISPAPGISIDFTNAVKYTVTAKDHSTQAYVISVTVNPPVLSSDKTIISFSFLKTDNPTLSEDIQGIISGQTILCQVPANVSVTALKPTITHTGNSLNPASGAASNFTTPVTYTVVAEDGSTQEYTVSVSVSATGPVVYVAGTQFIHNTSYITVWKNGTPTKLTNGAYNAYCESAFVSDNTLYVAGYQSIGHYWATYWTENAAGSGTVELNETINDAYANSIYVSDNNDVYVAGVENHGGEIGFIAKVWKNGVATALTTKSGAAFSVFVSGNDVYVAGFEETTTGWTAKVWKNGVATTLSTEDEKAYAQCVFVSGSDVYVAGQSWNGSAYVIKVWKNGMAEIITPDTQGAEVSSIFVSDGNVYLAGSEINDNQWKAKVWINGVGTFLSLVPRSDTRSVYVNNGDVYVAGWVPDNDGKNAAILWKNGTATVLEKDALATETYALSVMVK